MAYKNKEHGSAVPDSVPSYLIELGTRIDEAANSLGSRKNAAAAMKCSTDSLARYIRGENEPPIGSITRLAKASGYSIEWLSTGEGLKQAHLNDWSRIVAAIKPADEAGPIPPSGMGYSVSEKQPNDYAEIPLYEVTAAAGGGAVVEAERVVDFLHFKRDWIRHELHASPADLYLINVDGESMEPTLRPGDVILVDHRDQKQARDGIYVLRLDGALLVKRLQKLPGGIIEVTSDNPAYKPFKINADQVGDDFAIIGRVVWSGRRM